MVALIIIGVIVLIITAINLIPVGADLGYEDGRLHASAKVAGMLLQLFPRKKKKEEESLKKRRARAKKAEKPKKPREEKPRGPKRKLSFTMDEILELLRAVLRGVGKFGRDIRVDRFVLHIRCAGRDPYNTAMAYAYINAAMSSLAPLCRKLTVKNSDVWTEIDFVEDWPHVDFAVAMTIRIGQIVGVGLTIAFGALKILLRNKKRLKKEAREAAKNAPGESGRLEEIKTETEQTVQEVERMEANG